MDKNRQWRKNHRKYSTKTRLKNQRNAGLILVLGKNSSTGVDASAQICCPQPARSHAPICLIEPPFPGVQVHIHKYQNKIGHSPGLILVAGEGLEPPTRGL